MTASKVLASGLTGVCLALALGGAAHAQIETRSNAPIDITADQADVVQSKCTAIWRGAAEAVQDQSRLRADTITVYGRPKPAGTDGQAACGGTERIEADGHVYYVTPDRNARGDHAVYTQATDQIVMTGDVIVVQGQDVARGDKLIIDVGGHQARMVSTATGPGRTHRVQGVYFPDKTAQSTSTAPVPAPVTSPAPAGPPAPGDR
jgi:lipopolysaccharide export system protein LptA